jgi:hypothetical protein
MDPKAQSEPKIPGPDPDSDYAAIAKNFVKIFFFLNTCVLCLIIQCTLYNVRVHVHAIPCKRKGVFSQAVLGIRAILVLIHTSDLRIRLLSLVTLKIKKSFFKYFSYNFPAGTFSSAFNLFL